jgi:hypothetical protein
MKLHSRLVFVVLGFVYAGAAEPTMSQYNVALQETPAVSGYEQQLARRFFINTSPRRICLSAQAKSAVTELHLELLPALFQN